MAFTATGFSSHRYHSSHLRSEAGVAALIAAGDVQSSDEAEGAESRETSQENPVGKPARDVWLARLKDYRSDSYDISKLKKMPEKQAEL